jgi:hypothetical protein
MNREIFLLVDYKKRFGSKWLDEPYRSGLDKILLLKLFSENGFKLTILNFYDVNLKHSQWKDKIVVYTSSEDKGFYYKRYIEDVICALEKAGALTIPSYEMLRANNNKVFMELIRQFRVPEVLQTLDAISFGTYEELNEYLSSGKKLKFPIVLKSAEGAMSRGVYLAKDEHELLKFAKKVSNTSTLDGKFTEFLRKRKHKGYRPESQNQGKFILQPFVAGLKNDWKILIYGEKYYILNRSVKTNDFRASGSGVNYKSGTLAEFPLLQLDMVRDFFKTLNVPNLSVDFGFADGKGYIFEFQAIHFGTATHCWSKDYYEYKQNEWVVSTSDFSQEKVYVDSIVEYLAK